MNSRCARSPRNTSSSLPAGSPTNSMPTSYWSEKKYGRRSYSAGLPSSAFATTAGWLSARPVLDAQATVVERVVGADDVAGREDPGHARLEPSRRDDAVLDEDPRGVRQRGPRQHPNGDQNEITLEPPPVLESHGRNVVLALEPHGHDARVQLDAIRTM